MVNSLLSFNPLLRPSIAEIKSHPWYNGPDISEEELRTEFRIRREKIELQWKAGMSKAIQEKITKDVKEKATVGQLNIGSNTNTRGLLTVKERSKKVFNASKVHFNGT
jgi:serine/threonine protein kinase